MTAAEDIAKPRRRRRREVTLNVRLEREMRDALQERAERHERTLAGELRAIVKDFLEREATA